jgi:amidase
VSREGSTFTAVVDVPARDHEVRHSEWREPYGSMVVAVVRSAEGRMSGAFAVSSGPV